jgi:hypothetical protein
MNKLTAAGKPAAPRFRVGDKVRILYGFRGAVGEVVEDRGNLGVGGERIYAVRLMEPWSEMTTELPERAFEDPRLSEWLTADKSSGRISVKDASGTVHVYRKSREASHRRDWDAVWRGDRLELGYGSLKPEMKPAEVPPTLLIGEDTGGWEGDWRWFEYARE